MTGKRRSDIGRQNIEVEMREKRSLISHHSLRRTWEKEEYTEICMRDERRVIMW
jgi:hypothetical protein